MDFETVDVAFRLAVRGSLPVTYPYPLYAALSRQWTWLHDVDDVGIFSVRGSYMNGQLQPAPQAQLRVRTPATRLPQVISLTGKWLRLDEAELQVGVPRVLPLRPAASLYARLVQIKLADVVDGVTPEAFLRSAAKQLAALDIQTKPTLPLKQRGPRAGEPLRRVLHIKDERHVGFAMLVQDLSADESLRLQQHGLGGRRKMGCGLFLPARST